MMTDFAIMLWKEMTEFLGNRRFIRVFIVAVLAMGVLPALTFAHHGGAVVGQPAIFALFRVIYVLFATVIVVAQTAPDLVLHERVGHTLEYLLTTRLPDAAIFGAKILAAFVVGYLAALLAVAVQLIAASFIGGTGWHWMFLALPLGRVAAFGVTASLGLYVAVIGTFVGVRVGEQRAAYMITLFSVGLLLIPFLVGWLSISLTTVWASRAAMVVSALALILAGLGLRLFRREMLILYLQE